MKHHSTDPYAMLKEQHLAIINELEDLRKHVDSLQATWNRLLNIANESSMKSLQLQQEPETETEPEQTEPERVIPVWERDDINKEKPSPKSGKIITIIILSIILLLLIIALYLRSQGWTFIFE